MEVLNINSNLFVNKPSSPNDVIFLQILENDLSFIINFIDWVKNIKEIIIILQIN